MGEVDDLRLAVGALAAIGLAFGLSQPQVLGPSVVVGLVLLLAFYPRPAGVAAPVGQPAWSSRAQRRT